MTKQFPALLAALGVLVCASTSHAQTGRCPVVGDRTLSYATGIAVVSGGYAFTGSREVLKVIDVSDRTRPAVAGRLVLPGWITAIVAAREDHLYVWTGTGRLNIVDAQVPEDPRLVGSIELEGVTLWFPTIEAAGRHVFISPDSRWSWQGSEAGIRMIDVGDPEMPVEVARIEGAYWNAAISGSTLYALTNGADAGWRVDVFDISDPTHATWLGSFEGLEGEWVQDLLVDGSIVYVVSSTGLEAIDMSDPTNPVHFRAGEFTGGWNFGLSGGYLYAHGGVFFEVIDLRDPHNPVYRGSCEMPWTYGEPAAMAFSEGLVFISYAYRGFLVVDVSDPSNPVVIGQLVEGFTEDVAVAGRYGMRLQWYMRQPPNTELLISDLDSPGEPAEVGRYEPDWLSPWKLAVEGDSVYLMSRSGVQALDIGNPTAPRPVGRLETVIGLSDIAVADGIVYLAGDGSRPGCRVLQILDASELNDLEADGDQHRNYAVICDLGRPVSVAASGSYAYLGTESALAVIDVADPSAAFEIARVATPAHAVAIERGYAYVAAGPHGLRVYDIRVPAAPQLVSELVLPETALGPDEAVAIAVVGRLAYLGSSKLHAIDISDPGRPRVLWDYPRGSHPMDAWLAVVSGVAVAGSSAFLAQSWLGSTSLDISGCRPPRRGFSRAGSGQP